MRTIIITLILACPWLPAFAEEPDDALYASQSDVEEWVAHGTPSDTKTQLSACEAAKTALEKKLDEVTLTALRCIRDYKDPRTKKH